MVSSRAGSAPTVHRVKVTLLGSKPPIWRRLEVASTTSLEKLHHTIQDAFGWLSYHMWVFETDLGEFGDDWEHRILVEAVAPAEPGIAYPRCLTGRRACPPEDCGGIWGYEELIAILADPAHDEHEDRLEWLCRDSADQFDPGAFDLADTDKSVSRNATILVND